MPIGDYYQDRLPLYGPLKIENPRIYLDEAKERFQKSFNTKFPCEVSVKNFEFDVLLGSGAFGKVILVKYKLLHESYYALKVLSKKRLVFSNHVKNALREKLILQSVNCPFTVRLEYFSQDNSYIYFFLPFICGGELFTHLQKFEKFEETLSRFYAAQVVLGLEYLHHMDIVFRDIKPENLMIDHLGYLKITDFGFAKLVTTRTYTFCGTPDYIAPEIVLSVGYGKAVDWWALGVLIYEMCAGHPPFVGKDHMGLYNRILRNQYVIPKVFSKDLQDLLRKLLQGDVTRRYGNLKGGSDDVKYHPWFKHVCWLELLNRRSSAPFVPKNAGVISITTNFPDVREVSSLKVSTTSKYDEHFKDF